MYYVYILRSQIDQTKYIGITTNLSNRIKEHKSGQVKYSKSKSPYRLIWHSTFIDKRLAHNFEKYLKSSSGYAFTKKHLLS